MGIERSWQSTYAFRNFRRKTFELSRIYWTQQIGVDLLEKRLVNEDSNQITTKVIECSFNYNMHVQKVNETLSWLPTYMQRNRLHLLVIFTAFLEMYLKEIAKLHLFSKGYVENINEIEKPLKVSKIGEALGRPILNSSTLPEMINYAQELFQIDFGINANKWIKFYKIRCAGAHLGGIATPNFLKGIGEPLTLAPNEFEPIGLTWDELRAAMKYADEITALIDYKISSYEIKLLETEQLFRYHYLKKNLPKQNKIWQFLAESYSIQYIKRAEKNHLVEKYYAEPKRRREILKY